MEMPLTHSDPRFTMWSKSPSIVNQLAFAYGGDHAAAARAEVAGGSELADVGKLQLLCASLHGRHIDKATQRQPGTTASHRPEQLSTSNPYQSL